MIDRILEKLQGVKRKGPESWVARCPAHEDRSPSVTIKALPDGRILMHCFAGCGTDAILESVGLAFSDLFPGRLDRVGLPGKRQPFSASEALECLRYESFVLVLAASDLAAGQTLPPERYDRLLIASGRINSALEGAFGGV